MPVAPGAQTPRRPSPSPHSSPITLGPRPPCTTTSVSESDRNNNATPPSNRSSLSLPPPPPVIPNARRAAIQPRSPPVGARQKDLPPGAAPIGSIAMPPRPPIPSTSSQAMSVPLLACQLGRPVNLGERGPPGPLAGGPRPLGGIPPVSPHHISNLLSHTLFAAIPTGNGRIMARNINGTRKFAFWSMSCTLLVTITHYIYFVVRKSILVCIELKMAFVFYLQKILGRYSRNILEIKIIAKHDVDL